MAETGQARQVSEDLRILLRSAHDVLTTCRVSTFELGQQMHGIKVLLEGHGTQMRELSKNIVNCEQEVQALREVVEKQVQQSAPAAAPTPAAAAQAAPEPVVLQTETLLERCAEVSAEMKFLSRQCCDLDCRMDAVHDCFIGLPVTVAAALKKFLATKDEELHQQSQIAAQIAVDDHIKKGHSIFDLTVEGVSERAYDAFQRRALEDPELLAQILASAQPLLALPCAPTLPALPAEPSDRASGSSGSRPEGVASAWFLALPDEEVAEIRRQRDLQADVDRVDAPAHPL